MTAIASSRPMRPPSARLESMIARKVTGALGATPLEEAGEGTADMRPTLPEGSERSQANRTVLRGETPERCRCISSRPERGRVEARSARLAAAGDFGVDGAVADGGADE